MKTRQPNLSQKLYSKGVNVNQRFEIEFVASSDTPNQVTVYGHTVTPTDVVTHSCTLTVDEAKQLYRDFLATGYRTSTFATFMPPWDTQQAV